MGDILKNSRLSNYLNDPRYRQIPKHERKVKIDKRFQSMFNDEKFKVKYTVDKRGRPINETSTENLRKYYDLDESDESDDDLESSTNNRSKSEETGKSANKEDETESSVGQFVRRRPSDDEDNENEKSEEPELNTSDKLVRGDLDTKIKNRLLDLDVDYARGEGKESINFHKFYF